MLMAGVGERIHSWKKGGFTLQPLPSSSPSGCLAGHLVLLETVRRKPGKPEWATECKDEAWLWSHSELE